MSNNNKNKEGKKFLRSKGFSKRDVSRSRVKHKAEVGPKANRKKK